MSLLEDIFYVEDFEEEDYYELPYTEDEDAYYGFVLHINIEIEGKNKVQKYGFEIEEKAKKEMENTIKKLKSDYPKIKIKEEFLEYYAA